MTSSCSYQPPSNEPNKLSLLQGAVELLRCAVRGVAFFGIPVAPRPPLGGAAAQARRFGPPNRCGLRLPALCRPLHSPPQSWLISILLSRNRLRSLPGEAHVRNFYF